MAVTLYGKMYAQKVKSEGLRFTFVHASSAMGVWQPIRHPSRLQCPFFLEGFSGSPSADANLPHWKHSLCSGDLLVRRLSHCWAVNSLWKQSVPFICVSLLPAQRPAPRSTSRVFNKIMDFQGLAQTLLVASDRNSNSLSQRRK